MDLHPVGAAFREAVIPLLVTFRGLVHVRIPLPFFVFGGTRHLDQGFFHRRIAQAIPQLQQVKAQQLLRRSLRLRCQGVRRAAAFLARFGGVGLDQSDACPPGHQRLHLKEKHLSFDLLLGSGELVIREAELLATHPSSPCMR